jgi:hypothetical protein
MEKATSKHADPARIASDSPSQASTADQLRASAKVWSRLDQLCTPVRAAALIATLALIYGLATMRGHGVSYDEPALNYAGDRTLYWIQHWGAHGTLDLKGPDPADFASDFPRSPGLEDPLRYPVLPALIGSITSWLFHTELDLVDTIDGHHIGLLLLHAIALFLYCVYASRLLGRGAAIAATLALAMYPSAVGHSFNNAKDWPCAAYYGVFLLALGAGVIDDRFKDLVASGVLAGVAFASKMNAIFAIVTMVVWVPIAYLLLYRRKTLSASLVGGVLLIPYVACGVFFVTWPWLYQGKLPDWWAHVDEYVHFMVNYGVGTRPTWTIHALKCIWYMSPPLVLATAAIYVAVGWRGDRRTKAVYALLIAWLAVPVLRIAAPRSNFYDANRHFIEYVPGLCALAGAGAAWIGSQVAAAVRSGRLGPQLMRRARPVLAVLAGLAFAILAWPLLEYAPFEATYYNSFLGGLGAAQRSGLFATRAPAETRLSGTEGDYWFGSYRQGLRRAVPQLAKRESIGVCGPPTWLAESNWPHPKKPKFTSNLDKASLVFVVPREPTCGFKLIREMEEQRPIMRRIMRGGGLVYEILGRRDGATHPITTAESLYTQPHWEESLSLD